MPARPAAGFRLHHISTHEVLGSLGETGRFCETTPYDPRSPYSASKAASDHQQNVRDWLYVEDHVDVLLRWVPWGAHEQRGGGSDLQCAR